MSAQRRTNGKQENDSKIIAGFPQDFFVLRLPIGTQGFHAAAQITDTHGTGKSITVHLAESLYLHGAGERYHGIGQQIHLIREKSHGKQQQNLYSKHQLPPVDPLSLLISHMDALRYRYSQREEQKRGKIPKRHGPVPVYQILGQQHDITGLGIGEYLATVHISISIL